MTKPIRIQLKRSKGWRLPPNTVVVSRPGKWGNPFIVNSHVKPGSKHGVAYIAVPTIEDAVECFREHLTHSPALVAMIKMELRGKNLACWCKIGQPCHADVLLEVANGQ